MQKVSLSPHEWTLREFFVQLFNYCFPSDYRTELREKLRNFFQNNKTVCDYSFELKELFNMIGIVDEREKMVKFWNELLAPLQKQLWIYGLNPEIYSWDEIQEGAETLETSEKFDPQHRQGNNSGTGNTSGSYNIIRSHPHEKNGSERKRFGSQTTRGRSHASSSQRYQSPQIGTSNRSQSQAPKGTGVQPNNNERDWKPSKSPGPQKDRSTPRLSDKEKSELLASGSCFNCKKPGHLSRNCPQGNVVKSNNNKPPGLTNYNIEIIPDDSDDVVVLDNLELGMMEFENSPSHVFPYEPFWLEYDPESTRRRRRLGDALALMAEYVLDIMQPYPGDSEFL